MRAPEGARAFLQGVGSGSRHADVDEQPGPRRGRAARGADRLRRLGQGGPELGPATTRSSRRCARLGERRDAARPVAASRWACSDARGGPARADRQFEPRAALGDLGRVSPARGDGPDDVRPDDRRLVDLHRHAGHHAGHVRDVRRVRGRQHFGGSLARPARGHGRPGRDGRRAAAGRHDERGRDPRRRGRSARIQRRLETGYCDEMRRRSRHGARGASRGAGAAARQCRSACWATSPTCCPNCTARGVAIDVLTDQTSAHDLLDGLHPAGL